HEQVAVVTNPAIDGVREADHFSTRVRLGARPWLDSPTDECEQLVLETPLLLGGSNRLDLNLQRLLAAEIRSRSVEEILCLAPAMEYAAAAVGTYGAASVAEAEPVATVRLSLGYSANSSLAEALSQLRVQAEDAARYEGATILVLDDDDAIASYEPI